MKNVKLMQELLGEVKNYLVENDNSLGFALTKLRSQINDVNKINFNIDNPPEEHESNVQKLNILSNRLHNFKYEYQSLCERLNSFLQAIGTIDNNYKLFENDSFSSNQCPVSSGMAIKKDIDKLKEKIEQAKQDLLVKDEEQQSVEHA